MSLAHLIVLIAMVLNKPGPVKVDGLCANPKCTSMKGERHDFASNKNNRGNVSHPLTGETVSCCGVCKAAVNGRGGVVNEKKKAALFAGWRQAEQGDAIGAQVPIVIPFSSVRVYYHCFTLATHTFLLHSCTGRRFRHGLCRRRDR